jgi:hypothetical protein
LLPISVRPYDHKTGKGRAASGGHAKPARNDGEEPMPDDQLQEYRERARAWLAGGRRTVRPLVDMTGGTPLNVG